MSWHTSIIAVKAPSMDETQLANSLGYYNSSNSVNFEIATSSSLEGSAFAKCNDWIIGTSGIFWFDLGRVAEKLAEIPGIEIAISILAEGASGTYAFELVENGELVRRVVSQENEIVEEEGSLTKYEKIHGVEPITVDGESHVMAILAEHIAPFDDFFKTEFDVYEASLDNINPSQFM